MRRIRYQEIADAIRHRIVAGEFGPGEVLPSEARLVASYEASRVTIRKALDVLRADGLVDARQGFGWFVASDPIPQPLTGLATIEAQLAESGRTSERRILEFGFVDAPGHVVPLLGPTVLMTRRLNLADGQPFALVTVWCREDLGEGLSRADVERSTFSSLLSRPPGRARQTIGAALVADADADLLGIPRQSPVLVVKRSTFDLDGEAVLVSEHVFPGHLTEFVVELAARTDSGETPPGLRLLPGAARAVSRPGPIDLISVERPEPGQKGSSFGRTVPTYESCRQNLPRSRSSRL